jgi:hypothetical protein
MNKAYTPQIPAVDWEPVSLTEGSYVMRPEDFPEGCFTRMTGRGLVGYGKNKLGIEVKVPLNVRLCRGCDGIIVDRHCEDCRLVFVRDGFPVSPLGGNWFGVGV